MFVSHFHTSLIKLVCVLTHFTILVMRLCTIMLRSLYGMQLVFGFHFLLHSHWLKSYAFVIWYGQAFTICLVTLIAFVLLHQAGEGTRASISFEMTLEGPRPFFLDWRSVLVGKCVGDPFIELTNFNGTLGRIQLECVKGETMVVAI